MSGVVEPVTMRPGAPAVTGEPRGELRRRDELQLRGELQDATDWADELRIPTVLLTVSGLLDMVFLWGAVAGSWISRQGSRVGRVAWRASDRIRGIYGMRGANDPKTGVILVRIPSSSEKVCGREILARPTLSS